MVAITSILLNNPNTSDEFLAKLAKLAVKDDNKLLIAKIKKHPGIGPKTLLILSKH